MTTHENTLKAIGLSLLMAFTAGTQHAGAQESEQRDPPRLALNAGGHTAMVNRVFFRSGGEELISVSDDKTIRFWDVSSGEPLRVIRPPIGDGDVGMLYSAALSPDGNQLAVGGYTRYANLRYAIYVISLVSGEIEHLLVGHTNVIHDLRFSPDGRKLISASSDMTARIWDVATHECLQVLKGHTDNVYGVVFSPDGNSCATASDDDTAAIWNVATGQRLRTLSGHRDDVNAIAWSSNGKWIATGSYDRTIRVWNINGQLQREYDQIGNRTLSHIEFCNDSRRLIWCQGVGSGAREVGILDLASGESKVRFNKHTNTTMHASLSPDETLVASSGGNDKELYLWNASDGSVVHKLVGRGRGNWSAAWGSDGSTIAWGNINRGQATNGTNRKSPLEYAFELDRLQFAKAPDDETYTRYRTQRGNTLLKSSGATTVDVIRGGEKAITLEFDSKFSRAHNTVSCFTLLPGDRAAVGSSFGLYLFDTRSGKILRKFVGHTGLISAISPSPDGRYLLTASNDMTMRVWDPDVRKPLLNLFFAGEEWVAWTPDGYYASSPGGEALMGWHLDNGPDHLGSFARASQFRDSLYQPSAIKMLLRTGDITRALEATGKGGRDTSVAQVLPPTVFIARPDGNDVQTDVQEMTVMAVAKQVGEHPITSIQLLLDGRPYGGRAGIKHFDAPRRDVRERFYVQLSAGIKHRLQVRADSDVSFGLSRGVNVTFRPKSNESKLPALYVLSMGLRDYQDDELDLNFADRDARRFERAFQTYGKGLFRKVETKLVVNEQATRIGILKGLDWLKRQMDQGDIGLVYYSGHGDKDSSDVFHIMPHDVEKDLLSVTGIPDAQIKTMVGAINGRVLLVLDACNSGAAFKNPNNLMDDLIRDLVSSDYGITVMSSSTGKELSQESSDAGGGYFTIAFVEGLSGRADTNQDGVVYSSELANYVAERVKSLTKGQQHPVMRNPAGVPAFPLAKTR